LEIQQQDEPPEFIEQHYSALNHTLSKYRKLKKPEILKRILPPTEEEVQATHDFVKLAKANMRKISNQMDIESARRDTARNSPSVSITPPEPDMVREFREAVDAKNE